MVLKLKTSSNRTKSKNKLQKLLFIERIFSGVNTYSDRNTKYSNDTTLNEMIYLQVCEHMVQTKHSTIS